jgi:cyclopropane fatty-acyl-phospholipid synthase-like methyltransferase
MKKSFYELCQITGTDKVSHHGYQFFYPPFLDKIRDDEFNMLEIGYGTGQSMKMWCEYFPNANFFCADINTEAFYNDRCRVIKADQSNNNDLKKITKQIGNARLIVDDGSHNPKHQFDTFMYLFENLLEDGGIYIIEDIETNYWNPNCSVYGYQIGNFNLMKSIHVFQDMINHEFSKVQNTLKISTITYGQNCIIITKRTQEEQIYFNRKYRFEIFTT